jgi:hypothetical protein
MRKSKSRPASQPTGPFDADDMAKAIEASLSEEVQGNCDHSNTTSSLNVTSNYDPMEAVEGSLELILP